MEYWGPDPIIPVLHLLPYAAKSGDDLDETRSRSSIGVISMLAPEPSATMGPLMLPPAGRFPPARSHDRFATDTAIGNAPSSPLGKKAKKSRGRCANRIQEPAL